MVVQKKIETKQKLLDVINYFKKLPLYNTYVEFIDVKDPLSQSEASKSSMKYLFNDLVYETKSFKYQINVKILLKKYKGTRIEFSPVYFNSTTKGVINHKFDLDKSFQEILYRIDNWINEGSSVIVGSIVSQLNLI